ncbi:uncharacterized protein FIBRA_00059 [Fibroporia radiculosa]|uniref:DASH complex subunit ASK1 n=1 Tax=Fibroporia radiculosa TaxID=599839 RepID=J7RUS0_9APHY|nr:uncharacterized protein FIBRA_00059 [Fibroporia radiculosa]CCL98065.1 predicted protein [Fibroporia radiculosa]
MSSPLKPIEPKTPRWEPTLDPRAIVVPGLDTSAPVNDQIEQIEQLITIKLQNIDANFSKMQHVMANRILPAVKRYAVGTEPVREAARFWTTFFEQAAQIRVPTYEEYNSTQEHEQEESSDAEVGSAEASESAVSEGETIPTRSQHSFNSDGSSTDVSFLPQAALSSTPATSSRHRNMRVHDSFASQDSDPTPSWTASLESPLVQLDRDIRDLTDDDEASYQSAEYDESEEATQRPISLPGLGNRSSTQRAADIGKCKAKEAQPLLKNILRRNASDADRSLASPRKAAFSPLKVKSKTPILRSKNPYLPPGTKPDDWGGVIDLADPSLATPRKGYAPSPSLRSTARPASKAQPKTPRFVDDESFDVEFGMSPPVTMDFARLPKLGKTPKKDAAERILQSLLEVEKRGVFGGARGAVMSGTGSGAESSASSMPTPPSLSRYHRKPLPSETSGSVADASLESMMRRVGLDIPGFGQVAANQPTAAAAQSISARSVDSVPSSSAFSAPVASSSGVSRMTLRPHSPPVVEEEPETPAPPQYNLMHLQDEELQDDIDNGDPDDSMDSLDYEEAHNTANPSAAFIMASQRASYDDDDDDDDDSFVSDNAGDFVEGDSMEPVHPFARGLAAAADSFDDDDSFDDADCEGEQEETVFGMPPAQRLQIPHTRVSDQNLRMLGEDLLQDTIGIGTQMAHAGRVEESPTPFMTTR